MSKYGPFWVLFNRRARQFYVDATLGNDSNSGSLRSPWASYTPVAAVTNTRALGYFKRGESWSGVLSPPVGMTLDAYGVGARPILTANASWGAIRCQANHLIIRNLNLVGTGYDCALRMSDSNNNIEVDGCVLDGGYAPFYVVGPYTTTHHITLRNSEVKNAAGSEGSSGVLVMNAAGAEGGPSDLLFENLDVHDNGGVALPTYNHGMYLKYVLRVLITKSRVYTNCAQGITCSGDRVLVDQSAIYDNGYFGWFLSYVPNTNMVLQNSLIYNNARLLTSGGQIYVASNIGTFTLQFNTIVQSRAGTLGPTLYFKTGTGGTIRNNIGRTSVGPLVRVYDALPGPLTFDYNDWYSTVGSAKPVAVSDGSTNLYFNEWQALTGSPDAHGKNSNPLFTTDFTNLTLQAGSPCKLSATPVAGCEKDYAGVLRHVTTPSMGAYE